MEKVISLLNNHLLRNEIVFAEPFFISLDRKTIMGEVPFSEILFLDYRDTEAGSNPREFIGFKKTNIKILKSLLDSHANKFRFLHSGINVSLINENVDEQIVRFDECCLTNGNQTRFIILAVIFLKLFFGKSEITSIKQTAINDFVKRHFANNPRAFSIFSNLRYSKLNDIVNFLLKDKKYYKLFDSIDLESFVNSKIRIQLNLVSNILEDIEDESDAYSIGTLIAEANNDTQKVRADDIFGNKYKSELGDKIFKKFLSLYSNKIVIEYRFGEITDTKDKVHILTLLRPIIPTGILTQEKNIFEYTNQRDPIYKIFERLLQKKKNQGVINIISMLVPFLYELRENFVKPTLEKHKRDLVREYQIKALSNDLEDTIIKDAITACKKDKKKLEKLIRTNVNYNIEHILPILVFQLKKLISLDDKGEKIVLNIAESKKEEFLNSLIEVIYEKYVDKKLKGLPTSMTTVVRSQDFYEMGTDSYKTLIRVKEMNAQETDFILKNRLII